jgi:hypothetical protein
LCAGGELSAIAVMTGAAVTKASRTKNVCSLRIVTRVLSCLVIAGLLASSSAEAKRRKHRGHSTSKHASAEYKQPQTPRTPNDKDECITLSQAFYEQGQSVYRRMKLSLSREFVRVASDLDQFCGEEEFDKARISINWMNACLQNLSKDSKTESCSRDNAYLCAIDAQSEGCRQ